MDKENFIEMKKEYILKYILKVFLRVFVFFIILNIPLSFYFIEAQNVNNSDEWQLERSSWFEVNYDHSNYILNSYSNQNSGNLKQIDQCVDINNNIHMVWTYSDGTNWTIQYKKLHWEKGPGSDHLYDPLIPGDFRGSIQVHIRSKELGYPKIAVHPDNPDYLFMVWHEKDPLYFSIKGKYSSNGGNSWSNVITIDNYPSNTDSKFPDLTIESHGEVSYIHIVWQDNTPEGELNKYSLGAEGVWRIHYTRYNANKYWNGFSVSPSYFSDRRLNIPASNNVRPAITSGKRGDLYLSWATARDWGGSGIIPSTKDLAVAMLIPDSLGLLMPTDEQGNWRSADIRVSDVSGIGDYTDIALDRLGQIHVVWEQPVHLGNSQHFEVFYSKFILGGNTFSTPLNVIKGSVSDLDTIISDRPTIAVDGDLEVHITWRDNNGSRIMYSQFELEHFDPGHNQFPTKVPIDDFFTIVKCADASPKIVLSNDGNPRIAYSRLMFSLSNPTSNWIVVLADALAPISSINITPNLEPAAFRIYAHPLSDYQEFSAEGYNKYDQKIPFKPLWSIDTNETNSGRGEILEQGYSPVPFCHFRGISTGNILLSATDPVNELSNSINLEILPSYIKDFDISPADTTVDTETDSIIFTITNAVDDNGNCIPGKYLSYGDNIYFHYFDFLLIGENVGTLNYIKDYYKSILYLNKQPGEAQLKVTAYWGESQNTVTSKSTSILVEEATGMDIDNNDLKPKNFTLKQNYPNPFNNVTVIKYDLPKETHVDLSLYNLNGNIIEKLIDTNKNAGHHKTVWNATNVPTGIYFYKIRAGDFYDVKECILIK